MKLNNGVEIPNIGLGTWLIDDDEIENVVKEAIEIGYRHIDTAEAYLNEEGVGRGIKDIDRNKLFITSKIKAEYKTYESCMKAIDESLKKLNTDYIDLMLIHSPQPWNEFRESNNHYYKENLEVWKALEDAYLEGKIKAIGVSNFHIDDLENIIDNCRIKPMVNQVLAHVGQVPFCIINYCKDHDIVVEAYSPIAHGQSYRIDIVNEMSKKYHKSNACICLKYLQQLGLVVLPKASSYEHLKNNLDLDFYIDDEDMEKLNQVKPLDDYGSHDFFPVFKHSGE